MIPLVFDYVTLLVGGVCLYFMLHVLFRLLHDRMRERKRKHWFIIYSPNSGKRYLALPAEESSTGLQFPNWRLLSDVTEGELNIARMGDDVKNEHVSACILSGRKYIVVSSREEIEMMIMEEEMR